jgi:predicted MFS family arabinose efflux permease
VSQNSPTPATDAIEAKRRWGILGVVYLLGLGCAITMQSVPPILSLVMAEFELSYAQGGLLMSLFAVPGVIMAIPAGMMADRYGQKTIGIISLALLIAGTAIFASGNSLLVLALGRVVAGLGAVTLLVMSPQLLAQWFAGREIGTAMGVFNTTMPIGTILSLNFLSLLGENMGWRASAWASAVIPLIALVVFAFLFAPAPGTAQRTSPKSESFLKSIRLTGISIWIIGIASMLFNASAISLSTFNPDFLQDSGFSIASAGFITSAVMWPTMLFSPVVGYLVDKIDRKKTIIAIGGLAMAILTVMVPTATGWILALLLLIGAAQTLVPAPLFALPPEVTNPERLGLGFGIFFTFINMGLVAGPVAVGAIRDATGSYQASYALMAGFALLIIPTMVILRRRQKQT